MGQQFKLLGETVFVVALIIFVVNFDIYPGSRKFMDDFCLQSWKFTATPQ